MIEDMNLLSNGLTLQADLCIIGAGAAGILIAREFLGTNRKIVLLESGGIRSEITARHLHEGEVHDRSFRGLQNGRSRGFGGTTTLWGGQCIPLDPIDFEERPWVPSSGWPISANKLGPYYARAKRALEITNADADRSAWEQFGLDPILYDQATLRPIHGVFIKRPDLGRRFHKEFSNAQHIHVLLHANVTQLRTNGYGTRIETAEIRSLDGKVGIVHAGLFVLCTGGIENARMLLLSNEINPSGLGNGRDLVGRYFQDHPCGRCATIETDRPKVLQIIIICFTAGQRAIFLKSR
ncbi:MAG: FAD-dependent oxidoreductase [Rhodospirillales bacterium]|nr:FAD-dependent oxidoreductase [Rhodospirillales bacterium]